MIDRIDAWTLGVFDSFVGWNRDRGRADQWTMAIAALDMALALLAAALAVIINDGSSSGYGALLLLVVMPFSFGFIYNRERKDIARLRSSANGAITARLRDGGTRRSNLVLLLIVTVAQSLSPDIGGTMLLIAITVMDSALYLKGAMPPPPTRRIEYAHA